MSLEEGRKLVTIRKIADLEPIKGADRIECATVDGWELVVKKNEFKKGDFCVFFEIDSFLPDNEIFSFLGTPKTYQGKKGHRLKTIRMRKQISQGLALPIHTFNDLSLNTIKEGDDLTGALGVTKYDVADAKIKSGGLQGGQTYGKFPNIIPKTDQARVQNIFGKYSNKFRDTAYEETLKLDGSSMTCYKIEQQLTWSQKLLKLIKLDFSGSVHFGVCSRNLEKSKSDNSDFWKAAKKYNIEQELPLGFAIQGELIGPKIQKNHEKVSELEYHVFDVFDIEKQEFLKPSDRYIFVSNMTVPHVKVINTHFKVFDEYSDVKELLARVEGESMNSGTISEGRVYKPVNGGKSTNTMSFKVINNKYLLKCED